MTTLDTRPPLDHPSGQIDARGPRFGARHHHAWCSPLTLVTHRLDRSRVVLLAVADGRVRARRARRPARAAVRRRCSARVVRPRLGAAHRVRGPAPPRFAQTVGLGLRPRRSRRACSPARPPSPTSRSPSPSARPSSTRRSTSASAARCTCSGAGCSPATPADLARHRALGPVLSARSGPTAPTLSVPPSPHHRPTGDPHHGHPTRRRGPRLHAETTARHRSRSTTGRPAAGRCCSATPPTSRPVCTTELGRTASLKGEFDKRNVKAIAVSVDPRREPQRLGRRHQGGQRCRRSTSRSSGDETVRSRRPTT